MKNAYLRSSMVAMSAMFLFACKKDMSRHERAEFGSLTSSSKSFSVTSSCGQLRTQTQGGWGSTPSGNNPGTYLHDHFREVFGESLTVGCPSSNYITLTSAQAVTDLLPTGGKAAALTAGITDPVSSNNVLVGQLVALKLSVRFDEYDADFGQSSVALGDMTIASGPFKGVSVYDFLDIAERVLGGCETGFTPQQVNETASSINQNFVDGKANNGYLLCPGDDGGGGEDPLPA
ncbi:hypothetical protein [Longitalea luteola]|uniref:hypothetical protein n=1 Tax=Longitalea luteola TaxID=2812563 RepID=UPI001A972A4D|nr:hypothetical protein [Longitalea luteola]